MVGASLKNNEALSCGSLHKKVESEKQFQLNPHEQRGLSIIFFTNNC